MKPVSRSLLTSLPIVAALLLGSSCSKPPAPTIAPTATAQRYPLKGVITEVLAEPTALMIKHEDIPGYMPAMTMMFKVDAATAKAARTGQAVTGTVVERDGEAWVEDVKPVR